MIQDFLSSGLVDKAAERYRVIVFDRPGFGHSERPRRTIWTPEAQADLICKALRQIGVSRPLNPSAEDGENLPSWNNMTEARARRQFGLFKLPYLYSSEAARELANIRHNLQTHFRAGGIAAVRHELIRQWKSRRANRANSWQTAMYEAISHDDWFCGGGFA